jgi:hypothetical protein
LTPLELLHSLAQPLDDFSGRYAVAGGLAASFYRDRPRLTNDVDIAFDTGSYESSKTNAEKILHRLGLKTSMGWIAEAGEKLARPCALIIGHATGEEYGATIDFLLPAFPWLSAAVERAQDNLINYGFARLPTILPEDVIIAKAFAVSVEANRFKDLDDLQAIFRRASNSLDVQLLTKELERLSLSLPLEIQHALPKELAHLRPPSRTS